MSSGISTQRKPKRRRSSMKPMRVLICAATSLTRAGLQRLIELQPTLSFAGAINGIDDLPTAIAEIDPDVVFLHLESQSKEMLWDVLISFGVPVVLLSEQMNPVQLASALAGKVHAILIGDSNGAELAAAAHGAAAGLLVVSGDLVDFVSESLHAHIQEEGGSSRLKGASLPDGSPEHLTLREREVLEMMVEGLTNKEIAAQFKISAHTAKFHISSIMGKLNASTRTEAAAIGLRLGLITL